MSEKEKKVKNDSGGERFKAKLRIKELQLEALLDITKTINEKDFSTLVIVEKFKHFVKDQLHIEKLVLFSKFAKWRCLLDYGLNESELDKIDVERDLSYIKEITSVVSVQNEALNGFDMVVPVQQGDKALAYLLLGDVSNEDISVSSIIKHLNFLQLLTNICVSSIENQRLAKELLKQEKEQRRLTEKQNEILEELVLDRTKDLQLEKDESERLLHNILPKPIANELKLNGIIKPVRYESVSVLFTDFKGFTAQSSKISPQELIGELSDIFNAFDLIMERYGVEKIKTIGDAYMAVCGIPKESETHALQCIFAAMDMISFLSNRAKTHEIKWEMRVGIHSGPIVAGVVGSLKFAYDVWGDTVNTASRMESNGEPGRINISDSTYQLIKSHFDCLHRGKLAAKGKGEIDMYFINHEIQTQRYKDVEFFVVQKLENELPDNLSYHGLHHTVDVVKAANLIAICEKINNAERELIKVAALFHDIGFIQQYKENEPVGCEMAKQHLPNYNYSNEEIDLVCGMIMATKVPQEPKNKLEEIVADADLDYLGRADYHQIGKSLLDELKVHGVELNERQWNQLQVKFLSGHHYFTDTSKKIRESGKQSQLLKIINQVRFIEEKESKKKKS